MSNPIRGERQFFNDPDEPRSGASSEIPDDSLVDARMLQRALGAIRDRLRLQDGELEDLRAMLRSFQRHAPLENSSEIASKFSELEKLEPRLTQIVQEQQHRSGQRLIALEAELAEQRAGMLQIRQVLSRTDSNLQRLVTELDRLVVEVTRTRRAPEAAMETDSEARPVSPTAPEASAAPKLLESSGSNPVALPLADLPELPDQEDEADFDVSSRWKAPALVLIILFVVLLGGWFAATRLMKGGQGSAAGESHASLSPLEQARVYESEKNYPKAEGIYRQILKTEPNNGEVIRHLASVLFRQDKWDESASVLKKLGDGGSTQP